MLDWFFISLQFLEYLKRIQHDLLYKYKYIDRMYTRISMYITSCILHNSNLLLCIEHLSNIDSTSIYLKMYHHTIHILFH